MKNFALTLLSVLVITGAFGVWMYSDILESQDDVVKSVLEAGDGLSAASGPEMPFRYLNVGGVKTFYNYSGSLIQATSSVLCSIQSPAGTSTLRIGGIQLTTGTSTVTSLSATKSTAPYVAGTIIASTTVASGAQASLGAASSTVSAQALTDRIFSPNTYLVFSQLGGGVLTQSGSCYAEFTQF